MGKDVFSHSITPETASRNEAIVAVLNFQKAAFLLIIFQHGQENGKEYNVFTQKDETIFAIVGILTNNPTSR